MTKFQSAFLTAPGKNSFLYACAVDKCVEVFSSVCRTALESCCPLKTQKGKRKSLWWSPKLIYIKTLSRKFFDKKRRSVSSDNRTLYKTVFGYKTGMTGKLVVNFF